MRIEPVAGEFQITLTRDEMVIAVSALGWTDTLIPSDEAFTEQVGCSRKRLQLVVTELADTCRRANRH